MTERYVVYTQIHEAGRIERWYYGTYNDRNRANEVAYDLGGEYPVYHCLCKESEAKDYNIQNLPF